MSNILLTIQKNLSHIFDFGAIKTVFIFIFGFFISYFDVGTKEAILTLIILSVLDFIIQMVVIYKTELIFKISKVPEKAYKLLAHLFLIWVGALINNSIQVPTGYGIDDLLIAWFGLAEGLSLLEKAKILGIELPNWIFKKIDDKKHEIELINK